MNIFLNDNIIENKKLTKMIAHRGFSAIEKENTICSFIAAGNRSFYGIECDIHKTKDGKFVVCHDDDTKRIAPVTKVIKESTYEELKTVHFYNPEGTKVVDYYSIPLFTEYLECCIKYQKKCIIEYKNEFLEADIKAVLDIVNSYNYMENCIFISFFPQNLIITRKYEKEVTIQILLSEFKDEYISDMIKYKCDLDVYYGDLTEEKICKLHEQGILVNAWTVNKLDDCMRLINWGIDFITTNVYE